MDNKEPIEVDGVPIHRDTVLHYLAGLICGDIDPRCEADKNFLENLSKAVKAKEPKVKYDAYS